MFDILTLAATCSEMNGGAVVTNEATKEKFAIVSGHAQHFGLAELYTRDVVTGIPRSAL